jgi:hypothetical protein
LYALLGVAVIGFVPELPDELSKRDVPAGVVRRLGRSAVPTRSALA